MASLRIGDFAVSAASKSMRFIINDNDSEEESTRDMLRKIPPEAQRELDMVVGTFLNE